MGWAALVVDRLDRRTARLCVYGSQLGKYIPGGVAQAAGQVGIAMRAGLPSRDAMTAYLLFAGRSRPRRARHQRAAHDSGETYRLGLGRGRAGGARRIRAREARRSDNHASAWQKSASGASIASVQSPRSLRSTVASLVRSVSSSVRRSALQSCCARSTLVRRSLRRWVRTGSPLASDCSRSPYRRGCSCAKPSSSPSCTVRSHRARWSPQRCSTASS